MTLSSGEPETPELARVYAGRVYAGSEEAPAGGRVWQRWPGAG